MWLIPGGYTDSAEDVADAIVDQHIKASVEEFRVAPVLARGVPTGSFSILFRTVQSTSGKIALDIGQPPQRRQVTAEAPQQMWVL